MKSVQSRTGSCRLACLECLWYYLTHRQTNICKHMHVQCTVQKKVFNCKINWFWFVIVLTNFVYFSDLHAAVFLHELLSLIFKIFKSFLMCALVFYRFHIPCNKCTYVTETWFLHNHGIQSIYGEWNLYMGIFKIKAFSVRIFKAVFTLLARVIYRGLNCKLLV